MNVNGDGSRFSGGVGQLQAPTFAFTEEPNTGVYLESPGSSSSYTVSKRGVKRLRVTDAGVEVNGIFTADSTALTSIEVTDGTVSNPSIAFINENNTGFYRTPGTDSSVSTTVDGTRAMDVHTSYTDIRGSLYVPLGASVNYGFIGATGSGFSCTTGTAGPLSTYLGSAKMCDVTHTTYDFKVPIYVPSGTTSSYSFNGASNSGFSCTAGTGGPLSTYVGGTKTCDALSTSYDFKVPIATTSLGAGTIFDTNLISTTSQVTYSDTTGQLQKGPGILDIAKNDLWFGDHSDGPVTLSGTTTTLTRNMFYTTLTLNSSAILTTNGYKIYATTVTGDGTGIIRFNGADAIGSAGGAAGGLSEYLSAVGGSGGAINTNGTSPNGRVVYGSGGGRGADNIGGTKTGGAAGIISFIGTNLRAFPVINSPGVIYGATAGGGGAGGAIADTGGGGGAGGGVVFMQVKSFGGILRCEAKGGNGGPASGATGGVGGGGGGGSVYLAYETLTAPSGGGSIFDPTIQFLVTGGLFGGPTGNVTGALGGTLGFAYARQIL